MCVCAHQATCMLVCACEFTVYITHTVEIQGYSMMTLTQTEEKWKEIAHLDDQPFLPVPKIQWKPSRPDWERVTADEAFSNITAHGNRNKYEFQPNRDFHYYLSHIPQNTLKLCKSALVSGIDAKHLTLESAAAKINCSHWLTLSITPPLLCGTLL